MSPTFALILVVISVVYAVVASRSDKLAQGAWTVVWIAVIAAFIALQQGAWGSASAMILTIGLAAMAAFPVITSAVIRKRAVWALPVSLSPLALMGGDALIVDGHFVMLVVAAFATTIAGLSLVLGAAFLRSPRGLMPIAASALGGVAVLGFNRSPLATGFQIPLAGPEGPVYWELASVQGFPEGLRLLATTAAPAANTLMILAVLASLALLAIFAIRDTSKGAKVSAVGFAAALAFVVIAALLFSPATGLPDAQAYSDFTRLALQTRQIDPIMAETAHFLQTDGLRVDVLALAPDLALLALGALVTLFAGWQIRKNQPVAALASRDLFVRGVAFLWLGWFLTMLFQASLMGSLGLHSPGEWIHLGLVTLSTAFLLLGWRHTTKIGSRFAAWSPGVLVGVWLLFAALAWSYRAILGFSVTLG